MQNDRRSSSFGIKIRRCPGIDARAMERAIGTIVKEQYDSQWNMNLHHRARDFHSCAPACGKRILPRTQLQQVKTTGAAAETRVNLLGLDRE